MARTTLRLDDHLLVEAKRLAAATQRTLGAVIEDALRAALMRRGPAGRRRRMALVTFGGRGLLPGVDLDHSATLLDRTDGR